MPASLVCTPPANTVDLIKVSEWWNWIKKSNWGTLKSPGSNLIGQEKFLLFIYYGKVTVHRLSIQERTAPGSCIEICY